MVNCKLLTVDDDLNLKYQLKFLENGGRGKENLLSLSFFHLYCCEQTRISSQELVGWIT